MAHEYMLYVTFGTSKIVLQHPNHDASKNVSTPTISKFYEILRARPVVELFFQVQGALEKTSHLEADFEEAGLWL